MSGNFKFIRNSAADFYLTATGEEPGSPVILAPRKTTDMNFQLWESKEDGTYVNAASGFVLEAPTVDDVIRPGTTLVVGVPSGKFNQKWTYNEGQDYKIVLQKDNNLCVWVSNGYLYPGAMAIVDTMQEEEPTQMWLILQS